MKTVNICGIPHKIEYKKVKIDKTTKEWLENHFGAQTTVCKCEKCGLYYKSILGHECKEK